MRLFALLSVATALTTRCGVKMMAKLSRKERKMRYPNAGKVAYVLTKDAPPWGVSGDVIRVNRGFATNFLVPKSLGVPATPEVIAEADAKRAAQEAERLVLKEAAQEKKKKLMEIGRFTVKKIVGTQGQLFGSVTIADVLSLVKEASGLELEDVKIKLPEEMGFLGNYDFSLTLFDGVKANLVLVIANADA